MKTINLKGQEWSTENFNARKFNNGDPIPFAKSPEEFKELTSSKKPCFTYYNYDENNYSKYGCCYNWFALIDKRGIAPEGFRIPNNEDFSLLLDNYIGRDRLDDDKNENDEIRNKLNSLKTQFYTSLKSKESWNETNRYGQNILGTDTFGFSLLAVPGLYENRGYRFSEIGDTFALWSSSKDSKYRWKLVGQHFVELSGHPFKASKGFGPTDSAAFIRLI